MLISLYLGQVIKKATLPEAAEEEGHEYTPLSEQAIPNGEEAWTDLGGLLLPQALESQLVEDIIDGTTEDIESVINALSEAHSHYADFNQVYAFSLIRQLYEEATPAVFSLIETRPTRQNRYGPKPSEKMRRRNTTWATWTKTPSCTLPTPSVLPHKDFLPLSLSCGNQQQESQGQAHGRQREK